MRSVVVSGGVRHGEIRGLTTVAVMPRGREPQVAFAGVWSQAFWRHGRRTSQADVFALLDGTGREDRTMLAAAGGTAAGVGVTPLVMRCWPAIGAVAAKLWRDGEARHEDICAALGIPPKDNGVELSLIRSGSAPGSLTVSPPVPS